MTPGNATPVAPGTGRASDPEAEYFQQIEDDFVARRGAPLILSNADWTLVRKWRQAGIPLRVVLRGIRDALDGHAHSWGRKRQVGSLAYCTAEVEGARARWHHALTLGTEPEGDAASSLRAFADRLSSAVLPDRSRAVATSIAASLRDLGAGSTPVAWLEPRLAAAEAELLQAVRSDLGHAELARLAEEVDADLAPYRDRMPEKVLAQVRAGSLSRRTLEAYDLPRLSLFNL